MTTKHVFAFDYFGPEIRLSGGSGRSAIKVYLVSIQLTVWLN